MPYGVDKSGALKPEERFALAERDAMIERDGYRCWRCGEQLASSRGERAHLLTGARSC